MVDFTVWAATNSSCRVFATGAGANGVVKLGIHRETGQQFAIKIIDKARFRNQATSKRPDLYAEVDILRRVNHPSVTKFADMIENETSL